MISFLSISLDKMLPALTSLNLLSLAVKLQVNLYPARLFAALSKLFSFYLSVLTMPSFRNPHGITCSDATCDKMLPALSKLFSFQFSSS